MKIKEKFIQKTIINDPITTKTGMLILNSIYYKINFFIINSNSKKNINN